MRQRTVRTLPAELSRAAFVAALFSMGLAQTALAQEHPGVQAHDPNAAYDLAIAEAVSAYQRGDYDATLRAFAAAHALFPNARTHRGLGIALYALGDYPRAIEHLDAALGSSEVPLDDELREQTRALRDSAARQVGPTPPPATPESGVIEEEAPPEIDAPLEAEIDPSVVVSTPNASRETPVGSDPSAPVRRPRVAWALAGAAYGAAALSVLPWAMGRSRLNALTDWCADRPAGGCTLEQRDSEWEARHIDRLRRTARGLAIAGTVSAVVLTAVAWRGSRDRRVDVGVSLLEPGATLRLRF